MEFRSDENKPNAVKEKTAVGKQAALRFPISHCNVFQSEETLRRNKCAASRVVGLRHCMLLLRAPT